MERGWTRSRSSSTSPETVRPRSRSRCLCSAMRPAPTHGLPRSAAAPAIMRRFWGPLLFLFVVVGVFEVVFSIGQPLSDSFGFLLIRAGNQARPLLPAGWLQSLVLDGAWKGISSVLVFLPQILLLFLFIG